jgi:hypothetical protein
MKANVLFDGSRSLTPRLLRKPNGEEETNGILVKEVGKCVSGVHGRTEQKVDHRTGGYTNDVRY